MSVTRLVQGTLVASALILLASLEPAQPSPAPAAPAALAAENGTGPEAPAAGPEIAVPQPVLFSDG